MPGRTPNVSSCAVDIGSSMSTQDFLTIAILLSVALAALFFPGGPGTPKRFRLPVPKAVENWSA
jgi:hypothetical protein